MTTPRSKTGRVVEILGVGLILCFVVVFAATTLQRMNDRGARQRWRPPADPRPTIVEGRFATDTFGHAYRFGYNFEAADGQALSLGCVIHKGGRSYGTPHDCLDIIPEELRGQTVRVAYLDPVLDNGRPSGDHLILKVWRGDRLLLTRPVDNTW
jgi:hypothetical protein